MPGRKGLATVATILTLLMTASGEAANNIWFIVDAPCNSWPLRYSRKRR